MRHFTHSLFRLQIHTLIFYFPLRNRDSNISCCQSTEEPNIAPGWQESFVFCAGNRANKRADGTMEHAEPQPITEDEFCFLGNLLKTQNCQSAAHISAILMTQRFSFKMLHSEPAACSGLTHSTAGKTQIIILKMIKQVIVNYVSVIWSNPAAQHADAKAHVLKLQKTYCDTVCSYNWHMESSSQ